MSWGTLHYSSRECWPEKSDLLWFSTWRIGKLTLHNIYHFSQEEPPLEKGVPILNNSTEEKGSIALGC